MSFWKPYVARERGYGADYNAYLSKRTRIGGWFLFHRIIPNTLAKLRGKVVDVGCGPGEILARCPPGSIGLEVNDASIAACRARGLDVRAVDPDADAYRFAMVEPNTYGSLLMSHVLEHLPDTANALRAILASCARLGIARVVIKVPGPLAWKTDKTHVTLVDHAWLRANDLVRASGFAIAEVSYYPVNHEWVGRISPIHEMIVVYDRAA